MNRDGEFFIYSYCLDKKIHKNRWMVINYLPPNGVNCQTYPMLLDIGRRVQALCTTVSFDKPIISCVWMCVQVWEWGCVCEHPSFLTREDRHKCQAFLVASIAPCSASLAPLRETPPAFLASWLQMNREDGAQAQLPWCHGMRSWTQNWNKEGGDGKPWQRKLQKTPHSKAAPRLTGTGLSFLGRRAVGWLLVVFLSESSKRLWGLATPFGMQFPLLGTFRAISPWHSGDARSQRRSSFEEGFARWVGWLGIPNPQVSPQPSRHRPSWLTMALFPSGSHLVCGRILWAWSREGAGWHTATVGRVSMRNELRKRGGKCLVFLEAWDIIDHGIQNVFCTVQVYGKRLYAEKSQRKLCIKYKSSFMKKADTHKVLSS